MSKKTTIQEYVIDSRERHLVNRCLKEEPSAQKELYDLYKDAMYTLAFRIIGEEELAEDVLQETFIGVFKGLDKFQHRSSLGAWIKTILIRTAYKKLKKKIHTQPLEEKHTQNWIDWGEHLDAEYLEKAIQALPDGYRSVFVLIEIEGYTHKEVADIMDISIGTSKSQLFYAKKWLRKRLTQMEVDYERTK